MQTLFEENRLTILQKTRSGETEAVVKLLTTDPTLIRSKTTTSQDSLLHFAANHGHTELCKQLLAHGHEINPSNRERKTPYQITTKAEIKKILVEARSNDLFNKHFTAYITSIAPKSFTISKIKKELGIFNNRNFAIHPMVKKNGVAGKTQALTAFGLIPPQNTLYFHVLFHEEAMMKPYCGEALYIIENEQVTQIIEYINNANTEEEAKLKMCEETRPGREVRSFIKSISTMFELYPELKGLPSPSDSADIVHAKKFITGVMIHGVIYYLPHCSLYEQELLRRAPISSAVMAYVAEIYVADMGSLISQFKDEILACYSNSENIESFQDEGASICAYP